MSQKRRVLFLCTGNCIRSQMAEGLLRHLAGDVYESLSAGAHPAGYVHPTAVRVMADIGIDLSEHVSKDVRDFLPRAGAPPDVLVSLCDHAARECPAFPDSVERLHWPFADPIYARGSVAEKLAVFRESRDAIRNRIAQALERSELND